MKIMRIIGGQKQSIKSMVIIFTVISQLALLTTICDSSSSSSSKKGQTHLRAAHHEIPQSYSITNQKSSSAPYHHPRQPPKRGNRKTRQPIVKNQQLPSTAAATTQKTVNHGTKQQIDAKKAEMAALEEKLHRTEWIFEITYGETTCFSDDFKVVMTGRNFTFEFKVLNGDGLEVWIEEPKSVIMTSSKHSSSGGMQTQIPHDTEEAEADVDKESNLFYEEDSEQDEFTFISKSGTYNFCFTNHGSMLSQRKRVFLLIEPTDHPSMEEIRRQHKRSIDENEVRDQGGPVGFLETVSEGIWDHLGEVVDEQRKYRLKVQSGHEFAQSMSDRIGFYSTLITGGILLVGLGQTLVVRKLFDCRTEGVKPGKPLI